MPLEHVWHGWFQPPITSWQHTLKPVAGPLQFGAAMGQSVSKAHDPPAAPGAGVGAAGEDCERTAKKTKGNNKRIIELIIVGADRTCRQSRLVNYFNKSVR
jgi:hypothetical protein